MEGNELDWLFVQPHIEGLLEHSITTEQQQQNHSTSYGIEPSLITTTNGSNSFEHLLSTPTVNDSTSSFYSHSPLSNTTTNDGTASILSPAGLVANSNSKANKPGKRQRTGDFEAEIEVQRLMLEDELKMSKVSQQLVNAVPFDHPLYEIGTWSCNRVNCFLRTPLPDQPLDYYKDPFIFGKFAVHLFDPSERPASSEFQVDSFSRPSGRSVHLIVTELPQLLDPQQLDSGFAIIVAARRIQQSWQAVCMVSYEGTTAHKTRARTNEIAFRGNLEHCKGENGQRFWGQRSSHVRRSQRGEAFKPLRIEPKGKVGVDTMEEYCFFVALFEENGTLLKHVDGSACLAQSNIVRFEPKSSKDTGTDTDGKYAGLLREINKLSMFERADLTTLHSVDNRLRSMLAVTDEKILDRVGVKMFLNEKMPDSAIELSKYMPNYLASMNSDDQKYDLEAEKEYKARIRSVSRQIGRHHSDFGLVDTMERSLDVGNTHGANSRYYQILAAGIGDATEWLNANGVTKPNISAVAARAELTGYLMRDFRFNSKWMIALNNVYPDRILVDDKDAEKVYCIANTTYEAEIGLRDRMGPLARFAFCSKIRRDEIKETILIPYCQGFLENFLDAKENKEDILKTQIGSPYSTILVDEDKFFITLHAIFLDYFLYWIRFRNIDSVKRIAQRLLEDDKKLDSWFFEPSRLVKFE